MSQFKTTESGNLSALIDLQMVCLLMICITGKGRYPKVSNFSLKTLNMCSTKNVPNIGRPSCALRFLTSQLMTSLKREEESCSSFCVRQRMTEKCLSSRSLRRTTTISIRTDSEGLLIAASLKIRINGK
jgi:hypothetical protein